MRLGEGLKGSPHVSLGVVERQVFSWLHGQFLLRDFGFEKPTPGLNVQRLPGRRGFAERLTRKARHPFTSNWSYAARKNWNVKSEECAPRSELRSWQLTESIWRRGQAVIPSPATAVAIVHTSSSKGGRGRGRSSCAVSDPLGPVPLWFLPPHTHNSLIHASRAFIDKFRESAMCLSIKAWVWGAQPRFPTVDIELFACYGNNMTSWLIVTNARRRAFTTLFFLQSTRHLFLIDWKK